MVNAEDIDFLLAYLQLHHPVGTRQGKGTRNLSTYFDWGRVAKIAPMIFLTFPKEVHSLGKENRAQVRERLLQLTDAKLNHQKFEHLFDLVSSVYRHWLDTKRGTSMKFTITDVKSRHESVYNELMIGQGYRCAYCGYSFAEIPGEQTLDHIIPYRLGGDHICGSNWQILCKTCNSEKKDMLSIFQHRVANNWIYHLSRWTPEQENRTGKKRVQFAVILRDKKCKQCGSGPTKKELIAINESTGLSIPSNMVCVCKTYPDCEYL
jgi:5-methylcytosine-specific restriction endonuclease McrA